jgi:hypothetical protein
MQPVIAPRTRRQLFRSVAAVLGSAPFVALSKKQASANPFPFPIPLPLPHLPPRPNHHCLLKGTQISAASGDCPVEALQVGDEVQTLRGPKRVKWIGYRKFTKDEGAEWQTSVMPIRIAQSAIDDQKPWRDLYLSPAHSIFLNNALIPVMYLVNDASIAPGLPSGMSEIEYYHVELETHEVIYAERAPVESFLANDIGRETFSNFVQYERLYGNETQSQMIPFAPIHMYNGGRQELKGLIKGLVSNVVDVRDPVQIACDQLAKRAKALLV